MLSRIVRKSGVFQTVRAKAPQRQIRCYTQQRAPLTAQANAAQSTTNPSPTSQVKNQSRKRHPSGTVKPPTKAASPDALDRLEEMMAYTQLMPGVDPWAHKSPLLGKVTPLRASRQPVLAYAARIRRCLYTNLTVPSSTSKQQSNVDGETVLGGVPARSA